ncbi:uncharacterized protein LOC112046463 isoform X2 [Bicyclus anynana]|uniref:Uncharacterized protein LOC112046463 isoform X2 n=1 Tax=Bicyclus anynana TaxID=110368 RepID=A0A6J1MWB1_BICAN|nr:uncharacterized protein LOC112046463 isoform X2 [Bicyclus anynana]
MNDPWDVKSVRQSNQYMSCMKINGVPLLPPVLSKECRKEMQYYKLLAKEVEKRIQTLKPLIFDTDTESTEDKTDAPDLPESEHSYELSQDDIHGNFNCKADKIKTVTTEKCLDDCEISRVHPISNTFDNITSNLYTDTDSASSKLSSKFMVDLSFSINETGKNLLDSVTSSHAPPNDLPERDCDYNIKDQKEIIYNDNNNGFDSTLKDERMSFSVSITKNALIDPATDIHFNHDGPSSLSSKSFTGSLNEIHIESLKDTQALPLVRQRSYTVLKPSPMLLAHLEVQSMNTGIEVTSISMSESLSNISSTYKKRRSWDLESAKKKWSSMALELKKTIKSDSKSAQNAKTEAAYSVKKTPSSTKAKSLSQERQKRTPPKSVNRSEPIRKTKKSPVQNSPTAQNTSKTPTQIIASNKNATESNKQKLLSESDDPATRVRELYDKIQKQQLIQMANLVEKQKKEQMLLQHVFEEQNNLLFTQLKTICPKSPNEVKEAWVDKNRATTDRGPVSLSQVINHKPQQNPCDSPVHVTLTETNNYLNYCDDVLKKSRDITGSIKKHNNRSHQAPEKIQSENHASEGNKTRTHSPVRKNTPTSRKLTYETSASSDRECDQILTDRTNDTLADLNVTFPSDHSEESQPFVYNSGRNSTRGSILESPMTAPAALASYKSTDRAIRSMEETIQNSIDSMCIRNTKKCVMRPATANELAAASKIVAHAKGYLVRRLMRTERVQATVQTIKDALLCALQLHQDREGIRGADVDLHRRLIQQITAACYTLHDTFVASTPAERCAMIAADRSRRRSIAARLSPAPVALASTRLYRPTDLMSQSHTGAFPARVKRHAPSLMTQSNYETFSGDKTVRRYMPSPRRRPWR